MQTYELTYIVADLPSDDRIGEIQQDVSKHLEGLGGVIVKEEPWGKRKLAYNIGKNGYGTYITLQTHLEGAKVKEVERFLRLHPEVIRSLLLKVNLQIGKASDEAELSEAIDKRVEAKKTKKEVVEQTSVDEGTVAKSPDDTPTIPTKPKRVVKKSSNEDEKKSENEEERKKLVDQKLSQILGESKATKE